MSAPVDELPSVESMIAEIEHDIDKRLGVLHYPTWEEVVAAVEQRSNDQSPEPGSMRRGQKPGRPQPRRRRKASSGTAHEQN